MIRRPISLEMDPNYINAMHNLAVVYRRQKRMTLYVKTYKKSQRLAIKRPQQTRFDPRQKKLIRGLSGKVFLWLMGGLALILIIVWLLTR